MERDHSSAINEHKAVINQLNKKTDASMEGMKQQHAGAIAKVSTRFILMNFRNRTGTERKRQTLCGKSGFYLGFIVWGEVPCGEGHELLREIRGHAPPGNFLK